MTIVRLPGEYGESARFAMMPSCPTRSSSVNQRAASSGSSVCGAIRMCVLPPSGTPSSASAFFESRSRASFAARTAARSAGCFSPSDSMSNAMNDVGVSAASMSTRDFAGCSRIWSMSNSSRPSCDSTISPSTTQRLGSTFFSAGSSSGK